jgi:hypothetical protein
MLWRALLNDRIYKYYNLVPCTLWVCLQKQSPNVSQRLDEETYDYAALCGSHQFAYFSERNHLQSRERTGWIRSKQLGVTHAARELTKL